MKPTPELVEQWLTAANYGYTKLAELAAAWGADYKDAEIERLKAELGDLPEAQAMLLSDCKRKDALLSRAAKQTSDIDLLNDIETELREI